MKHTATTPLSDRQRAYYGVRNAKRPGSVEWCWQTILLMQRRWQQKTMDEAGFNALVDELSAHEAWKVVPPDEPYGSLDALLKAEIGHTAQTMRQELQQRNQAAERKAQQIGPQGKHRSHRDTNENVVTMREGGNAASYALRRLSRSPDPAHQALYQQCLAGDMTPNAAMIQAGLRTPRPSRKRSVLDWLHVYWQQATPDDRATFLAHAAPSAPAQEPPPPQFPTIRRFPATSQTARAITQTWGESYARGLMYELQYVLDPVLDDNDFDDFDDEDDEDA
jgi:hypothetical protein